LELTLSSVAAQTYPNIEHIVIDGGSTDGTRELLEEFHSKVPLRWLSESDSGMYAAINKGIELARGDVVAYLNSDDLYLPWSVDAAVEVLRSRNCDLVFGDLIVLVKRAGLRSARIQFYPPFNPRVYAHEVNMGQPTVFWHRRVSDRLGGFDEGLRYCGDFEYWLRSAVAGFKYEHLREALAVAVVHEEALSSAHYHEMRREFEAVKEQYSKALKPLRLVRLRALRNQVGWRRQVLLLRSNMRKSRPSSWANLIEFLRKADLGFKPGSGVRLLLPWPLPGSISSMWRLDPVEFENHLVAEISRDRVANRARGGSTSKER
jgi:glycosyltransferase involved in cell wall biosynthesis